MKFIVILLLVFAGCFAQPRDKHLETRKTIIPGLQEKIETTEGVIAKNRVENDAVLYIRSGKGILLGEGFSAVEGSYVNISSYSDGEPKQIEKRPFLSEVAVSPNPSHETIEIFHRRKIAQIKVLSLEGKLVFEKIVDGREYLRINPNIPPGVYLLTIIAPDNSIATRKIQRN